MLNRKATRRQALGTIAGAVAATGAGCVGSLGGGSSDRTLTILDWEYTYTNGVIEDFEDRHDATVELQAAQSSARNLSLLRTGRSNHDVVTLGNYAVPPAIEEDLIAPLVLDEIPMYDAIFDFVKKEYFTAGNDTFAVPKTFGQTPLVYNTDAIEAGIDSLDVLWNTEYGGRIGGRDDARLEILYANAAKGFPLNPDSIEGIDLDAVKQALVERLQLTGGLWGSGGESEALVRNGEVAVEPIWNYVANGLIDEGLPIAKVYPKEGTKAWFTSHTIRRNAENVDLARQFINEWHASMGWPSMMKPLGTAVPNQQVFDENGVPKAKYGLDDPSRFIYEQPKPPELIEAYSRTWSEAKSQASV
jgi:spermidine/putrescine transport system substrate-binding protein